MLPAIYFVGKLTVRVFLGREYTSQSKPLGHKRLPANHLCARENFPRGGVRGGVVGVCALRLGDEEGRLRPSRCCRKSNRASFLAIYIIPVVDCFEMIFYSTCV